MATVATTTSRAPDGVMPSCANTCAACPAPGAGSAPAQLRREVGQHALDDVGVVVDAQLVRHGEQQGVGGRDGLVLGQLGGELVRLAGVGLPEAGVAAVEVPDLVGAV